MEEHDKKNQSNASPKDPTEVAIDKKDEDNPDAGKPNDATDPKKEKGAQSQGGGFNLGGKIQEGIDAANSLVSNTASIAYHSGKILVGASRIAADKSFVALTTIKETVMGKNVENSAPKGPSPTDDMRPKYNNDHDNDNDNDNDDDQNRHRL